MSRFDATRRGRIAVWTGAALAWGTAVILAGQEPVQAEADGAEPQPPVETVDTSPSPMPTMPEQGLVIIRHKPSVAAAPEVRTVYVQQAAPASAPRAASPAPQPAAPAPTSGGS